LLPPYSPYVPHATVSTVFIISASNESKVPLRSAYENSFTAKRLCGTISMATSYTRTIFASDACFSRPKRQKLKVVLLYQESGHEQRSGNLTNLKAWICIIISVVPTEIHDSIGMSQTHVGSEHDHVFLQLHVWQNFWTREMEKRDFMYANTILI
jgi:hypothetical protein